MRWADLIPAGYVGGVLVGMGFMHVAIGAFNLQASVGLGVVFLAVGLVVAVGAQS